MENKKLKFLIFLIVIILIMGVLFVFNILKNGFLVKNIEIDYPSDMTLEVENAIDENIVNKIL